MAHAAGHSAAPSQDRTSAVQAKLDIAGYAARKRTVERDLTELSSVFPIVRDDPNRPRGWSWMTGAPAFDVPNLSNQEALAFVMIESYLKPLLLHVLVGQLMPYFELARQHLSADGPRRGTRSWLGKIAALQPTQTLIPARINPGVQASVSDALLGIGDEQRPPDRAVFHQFVVRRLAEAGAKPPDERGPLYANIRSDQECYVSCADAQLFAVEGAQGLFDFFRSRLGTSSCHTHRVAG